MTDLVILLLASWRLTNVFVDDDEGGPWQSLHWLRAKVGVRYDEKHRAYGTNIVARAMTCFWCWSIWIGVLVGVLYLIWPGLAVALALPFALSAGALMVKKYMA